MRWGTGGDIRSVNGDDLLLFYDRIPVCLHCRQHSRQREEKRERTKRVTNFAGAGMPKTRDEECECLIGNGFLGGLFGCHIFFADGVCTYV